MENISVMIWNELNRFVGIEEQVLIRRRKYELDDLIYNRAIFNHRSTSLISSGSKAEGLSLPGSDIDIMYVLNDITVSCSDNVEVLDPDIVMDTTDIKPGFVRLRCHERLTSDMLFSSALTETDSGLVLSSLLFRDAVVDISQVVHPSAVAHGPCFTVVLPSKVELDSLHCFHCKTWPAVVAEWIDRHRNNNWPPRNLITDIVQDGFLIVPIGNPHSQYSYIEWRISFSTAEKKLVHSMNHSQFLSYGLLKLYLKHVINSNQDVKDLLCSYFLKTSLFYSIEEEPIIWSKESFLDCFWTCIRRLIKWVRDEYCPNYFIKDNNMFEGKICGDKGRILLRYLIELYHEGLYSLWRIPCLSELQFCSMDRPALTGSLLTDVEREYLCDEEIMKLDTFCVPNDVTECMRIRDVNADMIQSSTSNIDKPILTLLYHKTIDHLVQLLYKQIIINESNINRYERTVELKSLILNNCMDSDKCTGMLLLATLCYLKSEYRKVVTIVQKLLKKIESRTFYRGLFGIMTYDDKAYIERICGKGLTLNQKLACNILVRCYRCRVDCKFFPQEIEQELVQHSAINNMVYINLEVYSYALLFLSYLHMNSGDNMCNTLSELYTTVYDRQLVHEMKAPLSISLLMRCIQLCESWQCSRRESSTL